MCTVTVVRAFSDSGVRLAFNRDEQRTRAVARPPMIRDAGELRAVMPIDVDSGGTWIAVSSAGLIACLLNATPPTGPARPASSRSRGEIVPRLIASPGLADATAVIGTIDPRDYPPFRLLLVHGHTAVTAASDGASLTLGPTRPLDLPIMLTSSGLGDHIVEQPRRGLFEKLFAPGADPLAAQQEFHAHSWEGRGHLSVNMSRTDARTVSRTVIDVDADSATMSYAALVEGVESEPRISVRLPLESEALR